MVELVFTTTRTDEGVRPCSSDRRSGTEGERTQMRPFLMDFARGALSSIALQDMDFYGSKADWWLPCFQPVAASTHCRKRKLRIFDYWKTSQISESELAPHGRLPEHCGSASAGRRNTITDERFIRFRRLGLT